ncbi:hypothetical protein [Corynebacterium anserum]|uniref:hypothetical protein n=1 Tax=Corynebacterium anserum TaxID=2684406 RepID=UPI001640C3D1|nr:hypothetical protein [Corynebacterium anserum]
MTHKNGNENSSEPTPHHDTPPYEGKGADNYGMDDDATQVFTRVSGQNSETQAADNPKGPKPPEYHRAEEYEQYNNQDFGSGGYDSGYGQPGYGDGYGQPGYGDGYGQPGYGDGYEQPGYGHDSYNQDGLDQTYGDAYASGYGARGYGDNTVANDAPAGYGSRAGYRQESKKTSVGKILAILLPLLILVAIGVGVFLMASGTKDKSPDDKSTSSSTSSSETTSSTESTTPSKSLDLNTLLPSIPPLPSMTEKPSLPSEIENLPSELPLPDLPSVDLGSLLNRPR